MNRTRNILIWIFAFIFTIGFAIYQRVTGPTYPLRGKADIDGQVVRYSLPRTHPGPGDEIVTLRVPDQSVTGRMLVRRYKSNDEWTSLPMQRNGQYMHAPVPHQPIAGKVMYDILLSKDGREYKLTAEPVIIRFRGEVSSYIFIPHILLIFAAMLFSMRTGLEVLFKGPNVYTYTKWTALLFFLGGLIMGPLMQWYAFEAFWTGWPFGHDLTDNKSLVGLIMWIVAFFVLRKNPEKKGWALAASIVLILVFLIPHSVLGSEIDYTKLPKEHAAGLIRLFF